MTPAEVFETSCPLDCPDACSLEVKVEEGRVVKIEGTRRNPVTKGFICAKVRRYPEHLYGPDRLLHPMRRAGAKGEGLFARISWDEALDLAAARLREARDRFGGESILPHSYGGSNGLLTQDTNDALLFSRLGASRLARTICSAVTTSVAIAMYGKIPGVAIPDFVHSKLIVVWGANPSAAGIHLVPVIEEARARGAKVVVVDPRRTGVAAKADLHIAVRPGTDVAIALAMIRHLFESKRADLAFLDRAAIGGEELRHRANDWTFERAEEVSGVPAAAIEQLARWYAEISPAVIRCGWGLERNRNGGSSVAAVLALPAVGGKFGVRGGGYVLSNGGAWRFPAEFASKWDTRTVNMNHLGRALTELDDPPLSVLFVYNSNALATAPDQERVRRGLERDDLFTIVFDQVMTDTARYADLVLPATTFLEHDELARSYGAYVLHRSKPVTRPAGEARPNFRVFGDLAVRLGLATAEEIGDEEGAIGRILDASGRGDELRSQFRRDGYARPSIGDAPVQLVDVMPLTADGKIHLVPSDLDAEAPEGLFAFRADPATDRFPLALISPSTNRTISSSLGELHRKQVALEMNPGDAAPRGLANGERVRVWNELGEVICDLRVTPSVRPGVVELPKGLWSHNTRNGRTSNALVPDALTDVGGGACFNDARVQVERATR